MKRVIIILVLLVALISSGCAVDNWTLVDEGVLTNFEEIKGRYAITFDYTRVALLQSGYGLELPPVIVLHQYYYLYKEDADASGRYSAYWGTWSGYHLVETRR